MRTYIQRTRILERQLRVLERLLGMHLHSLAIWERVARSGAMVYALGYDAGGRRFPTWLRIDRGAACDAPMHRLRQTMDLLLGGARKLSEERGSEWAKGMPYMERLRLAYDRGKELMRGNGT